MADLSSLSTEDLMKAAGMGAPSPQASPTSQMSNEDLMKAAGIVGPPKTSTGDERLIQGIGMGATVDMLPRLQAHAGMALDQAYKDPSEEKTTTEEAISPTPGPIQAAKMLAHYFEPSGGVDAKLKQQGFNINQPDQSYDQKLAEMQARDQRLHKESGGEYGLGKLLGGLLPASVGGAALKATNLSGPMTSIGQYAKEGAKLGGLLGAAQDPGGNDLVNLPQRALNTGIGSAAGAATGTAMGYVLPKLGLTDEINAKSDQNIPPGSPSSGEPPKTSGTPQSLDELIQQYEDNPNADKAANLPSAKRLDEIKKILPDMKNQPLPLHDAMVQDRGTNDIIQMRKSLPDNMSAALNDYESRMKTEAVSKLGDEVTKLSGRQPLGPYESGQQIMSAISDKYNVTKDMLTPFFNDFRDMKLPEFKMASQIRDQISKDIPSLGEHMDVTNKGQIILPEFSPKMGISEPAYSKLNTVVDALNSKSVSFKDLQNIREYLRQSLDPMNPGSTRVLSQVRKSLLNYMDYMVSTRYPNQSGPRDIFKQYAQNEKFLDQMETVLGGKVEDFNKLLQADPERALKNIFSSTNNASVVKEGLGDSLFNGIQGDYLNTLVDKATDPVKGFSSAKLASSLKQNGTILKQTIPKENFDRIGALTDLMRIIPDAAPANPSGTAKGNYMVDAMKDLMTMNPLRAAKTVMGGVREGSANKAATQQSVDQLKGLISGQPSPVYGASPASKILQQGLLAGQAGKLGQMTRENFPLQNKRNTVR